MEKHQRTHTEAQNDRPFLKQICEIQGRYKDKLSNQLPQELPPNKEIDSKIEVIARSKPPSKGPYQLNQKELLELKKQINDLLLRGYITVKKLPYGSSVFVVHKKINKLRMCIDHRILNKVTIKIKCLLPRMIFLTM